MATSTPAQSTANTAPGSELTVAILESELAPVAARWETFGRRLRLEQWRLDIIAANYPINQPGAVMKRLCAVLQEWRNSVPGGSWSDIISALRDMEENALAREIEMKYCCSTAQVSDQQEQTEELQIALAHTNEIMLKDRFAQLQIVVYQTIQKRLDAKQFGVKDFRAYITALFPPQESIPETTDVSEIFAAITHNALWDYFNFEPLERVANRYGDNDPTMMAKLEEYSQALVGYKVATKMADHLSSVPVPGSSESEDEGKSSSSPVRRDQNFRRKLEVKLKVPVSEQSLSYIDEIWKQLAKRFLIPPASAVLEKITEGSLYITWLIPTFFLIQMMEMAEQPEVIKVFRKMEAELITVDGVCLYKAQEHDKLHDTQEQEDSDSDSAFDDDLAAATQEHLVADQHQPCTTCKCDFKATHQCPQCAGGICDQCNEMHKVLKVFDGHHPVKLDDCPKHSKMLSLFCTDSGCQHRICSQCIMPGEDHAGHNYIPIAEPAAEKHQSQHYSTTTGIPDAQQVTSIDHTKIAVVNPPDLSKCSYKGPEIVKSNQKICCRVLVVDSKGQPCNTPHDVRVIFKSRADDIDKMANRNGTEYQVLFTPKTRGSYNVIVTVNGMQISGSPFKMLVTLPPKKMGSHGPVKVIPNMKGPTRLSFITETGFAVSCSGKQVSLMRITGDQVDTIEYQAKFTGIEYDRHKNIYVVASSKSQLVKFAPNGDVLKEIGSEGSEPGQFCNPAGICIHNERVIVADSNNDRLQFFDQDLNFIRKFNGDNQCHLRRPQGITFDGKGAMYVADGGNRCIQKFQDDKLVLIFGMERMQNPMEVVLDRSKKYVLVSDYDDNSVFVYDTGGRYVHSFGGEGSGPGQFRHPIGLAMDGDGYLWVCDFLNNRLQVF